MVRVQPTRGVHGNFRVADVPADHFAARIEAGAATVAWQHRRVGEQKLAVRRMRLPVGVDAHRRRHDLRGAGVAEQDGFLVASQPE